MSSLRPKKIRHLPQLTDRVFLTFDDGPEPGATEAVLDVLATHQAKATFFLIAEKARRSLPLAQRILAEGHSIGDHSLDHKYRNYFSGERALRKWLEQGAEEWHSLGLRSRLVGFRPPAGICTPSLMRVVADLNWPLILWNERFFDAVFAWTDEKARRSAHALDGGSIVLLHDRQSPARIVNFCKTLSVYIEALKQRGFRLSAFEREMFE